MSLARREFGDFQTPPDLADAVLRAIGAGRGRWTRAIEPTCGGGSFIAALLRLPAPPREIRGIEIQPAHAEAARRVAAAAPAGVSAEIIEADIFRLDLARSLRWSSGGPLLVLGNPPWVTSAELGALGSSNLPPKSNLKGLRGIDALTGESNFDLAESVWLKLIRELAGETATIALLSKVSVARNVLAFCARESIPVEEAAIRRIDARRWFGAAVDACLFSVEMRPGAGRYEAAVYPDLEAERSGSRMGFAGGEPVEDLEAHGRARFADGRCPFEWRQGLKHDAAAIFELAGDGVRLRNGFGEEVDVEAHRLFPLLKCTDLHRQERPFPRRWVIVPQWRIGEDTARLEAEAPRLWRYLLRHRDRLDARRSSIYRGHPPFSVFGVGEYTFASWKVAVSGLHLGPRFRPIGPAGGRPVILDDTCYFIPAGSARRAALIAALLEAPATRDLIAALSPRGAKRPVTKKLLRRIDLRAILERGDPARILETAEAHLPALEDEADGGWPQRLEDLLAPAGAAGDERENP
jgi:hypothetical protein